MMGDTKKLMVVMMMNRRLTDLGYRVLKAARVAKAVTLASTKAVDGGHPKGQSNGHFGTV
jgi:hypothetical protein